MIDRFPYGKAPFWLACVALLSTLAVLLLRERQSAGRADLTFALFAPNHLPAYNRVAPAFERKHHVRVSFQLVQQRALQTRLQNALMSGTDPTPVTSIESLKQRMAGDSA